MTTKIQNTTNNYHVTFFPTYKQIDEIEKWFDFEEHLALIICTELSKLVTTEYWTALKEIFKKSDNENFIRALNKVP